MYAVLVAAHVSEPAATTVYGLTPRRLWATMVAALTLVGVGIGALALARPGSRFGTASGPLGAILALVVGEIGAINGGLDLAIANRAQGCVPVKFSRRWRLGLEHLPRRSPASQQVGCDNFATLDQLRSLSAGQSGLTYDALVDHYTYVWRTQKTLGQTCRQLLLRLTDGTYHIANFKFDKIKHRRRWSPF